MEEYSYPKADCLKHKSKHMSISTPIQWHQCREKTREQIRETEVPQIAIQEMHRFYKTQRRLESKAVHRHEWAAFSLFQQSWVYTYQSAELNSMHITYKDKNLKF